MPFKPGTKSERLANELLILDPEVLPTLQGTLHVGTKSISMMYYANGKQLAVNLATYITGEPAGPSLYWHHKNGDPFDYTRENLELRPRQEISGMKEANTKFADRSRAQVAKRSAERKPGEFIGVINRGSKHYARLTVPGTTTVTYPGGAFDTPAEAARAYDAARVAHGLQAVNFPGEPLITLKPTRQRKADTDPRGHTEKARAKIQALHTRPPVVEDELLTW